MEGNPFSSGEYSGSIYVPDHFRFIGSESILSAFTFVFANLMEHNASHCKFCKYFALLHSDFSYNPSFKSFLPVSFNRNQVSSVFIPFFNISAPIFSPLNSLMQTGSIRTVQFLNKTVSQPNLSAFQWRAQVSFCFPLVAFTFA